jgi:hypothetical protein
MESRQHGWRWRRRAFVARREGGGGEPTSDRTGGMGRRRHWCPWVATVAWLSWGGVGERADIIREEDLRWSQGRRSTSDRGKEEVGWRGADAASMNHDTLPGCIGCSVRSFSAEGGRQSQGWVRTRSVPVVDG